MSNAKHPVSGGEPVALLADLFWSSPPAVRLAALRDVARTISLSRGARAPLTNGADRYIFIARGVAKLVAHVGGDRDQILSFHFAGDLMWMPTKSAHDIALYAITESELVVVPVEDLHAMLQSGPELRALVDRSWSALERSRAKAILLGRKTARERMADFLVGMAQRIGSQQAGGQVAMKLPMSRRDIADSLGMTIETVSRQLSDLRGQGLIEVKGRSFVRIVALDRVARLSGRNPESE